MGKNRYSFFLDLLILFYVFMENLPFQIPMILSKYLLFMKTLIMEAFTILGSVNQQNGASQTFENGTMKLNVTQTDEYVSVDSDQSFDLASVMH